MSELSERLKQWSRDLSEWMDTPEFPSEDIRQKVSDLLAAADAIEAGEWKQIDENTPRENWVLVGRWWDADKKHWLTSKEMFAVDRSWHDWTHWKPLPAPPEAKR